MNQVTSNSFNIFIDKREEIISSSSFGKKVVKVSIYNPYCTPSQVLTGNGDAILDNICVYSETDENLETGEYYFDGVFVVDDNGVHKSITEESILKVRLDYGEEIFRIAKVTSNSKDITVFARQITISETLDMWLEDSRPAMQNGQGAMSWIKHNSKGKKDIQMLSDIPTISTAYYMNMNVYEALHTSDQSFINRWGGEVKRRGYNLYINKRLGTNRGVQIRSRKNLTGFEADTNIDSVVTRIKPVGFDGITIDGYVDSPLINTYHSVKTRSIKFEQVKVKGENSDEGFDTLEQAQAELVRLSELEFSNKHIDKLQADYRVNFVQLEQTEEYKHYALAERVFLGDEIDVYEEKLDTNITVRAMRKRFDILRQKTIEIELSNGVEAKKPPTIGDVLDKLDKVESNNDFMQEAIQNATDLITNGLKNSYVVVRKNEILIMDTQDINTATNVWRFNNGGLGHSATGYNGPYSTAITQDGSIVATMISTGILNANLIRTGTIRSLDNNIEFNLNDGGIDLRRTSGQFKNLSLRKGSMFFYNWLTGLFLGGISPSLLGGQEKEHAGIGIIASDNASYIAFANDGSWVDDSNGSQSPTSAMNINFIDRGSETALFKGIQLFLKMYARNGINLVNTGDIENLRNMFLNGIIQFSRGYAFSEYENGIDLNGTLKAGAIASNVVTCKSGNDIYSNANFVPYTASKYNCGEYNYPWAKVYSNGGVLTGVTYNLNSPTTMSIINNSIIDLIDINENGEIDVTNIIGTKYEKELLEGSVDNGYFINQDKLISTMVAENKNMKSQQFEQDEIIIENAFEIANIQLGGMF